MLLLPIQNHQPDARDKDDGAGVGRPADRLLLVGVDFDRADVHHFLFFCVIESVKNQHTDANDSKDDSECFHTE